MRPGPSSPALFYCSLFFPCPLCSSRHAAASSPTPISTRSWSTAPGAPLRLSYWLPIGVEETPRHTRPRAMEIYVTYRFAKLKTLPLLYWNPFFLVQINNSFLSFLLFFFFEGQEKHTFKQHPQISSFYPKSCRKNCTFYRICFSCAHMGKTI